MLRNWKGIQRALAGPLSALMLFMGVVPSLLHAADAYGSREVIESAHDPESCPRTHDHSVCRQIGSSQALPAPLQVRSLACEVRGPRTEPARAPAPAPAFAEGHPTRGPPAA